MGVFHAQGGGRKVRALPRKFVFLGFRREESGMSREFCRDVPDPWGCSKSLCKKKFVRIFRSLNLRLHLRMCFKINSVQTYTYTYMLQYCANLQTHFFLRIHFSFFRPVHPTLPQAIFFPKIPLSGTANLLFLVEKRQPAKAGFWGRFWTRSPHRKKGKSFLFCLFSGVRNKGEYLP